MDLVVKMAKEDRKERMDNRVQLVKEVNRVNKDLWDHRVHVVLLVPQALRVHREMQDRLVGRANAVCRDLKVPLEKVVQSDHKDLKDQLVLLAPRGLLAKQVCDAHKLLCCLRCSF